MWAEAFRSVEDIQQLITLAKKVPKQQLMATYYARLTQIFAVSENHLYHAYAWLKLFNFTKSYNKNMTPPDLQSMASSVLLAMLSILPYDPRAQLSQDEQLQEQEKERILRMANILGFAVVGGGTGTHSRGGGQHRGTRQWWRAAQGHTTWGGWQHRAHNRAGWQHRAHNRAGWRHRVAEWQARLLCK